MKKSSKKTLEQRGVIVAGRAMNAPSSRSHEDKRHLKRSTAKQNLKREYQRETARNRGPFPFLRWYFVKAKSATLHPLLATALLAD